MGEYDEHAMDELRPRAMKGEKVLQDIAELFEDG